MALFTHCGRKSIKYVKLITQCFSIAMPAWHSKYKNGFLDEKQTLIYHQKFSAITKNGFSSWNSAFRLHWDIKTCWSWIQTLKEYHFDFWHTVTMRHLHSAYQIVFKFLLTKWELQQLQNCFFINNNEKFIRLSYQAHRLPLSHELLTINALLSGSSKWKFV